MKKELLLWIMMLVPSSIIAQYTNVSVDKTPASLDIVQVDFLESSTLIYRIAR